MTLTETLMQSQPTDRRTRALGRVVRRLLVIGVAALVYTMPASAAEFSINPLRIELAPGERSGAVGVSNADQRPIRFQITLVEWTQDADGKDVYRDSDDLIYFPRLFTVAPGEQAMVRVGPKRPYAGSEKTYRLFIDELLDTSEKLTTSGVRFHIRFALPIFVGPTGIKAQGLMEPLTMDGGKLRALVKNTGSTNFRIEALELSGDNGHSQRIDGWYLLAGRSRVHTLEVPKAACLAARRVELKAMAGEQTFSAGLDVLPAMCGQ